MRLGTWLALLGRNQLAVHPARWPMAATVAMFAGRSSILSAVQTLAYGAAIRRTALVGPPLVIVGHWRSGTTYLHELLSLDERFTTPITYQAYAAGRAAEYRTDLVRSLLGSAADGGRLDPSPRVLAHRHASTHR